MSRWLRQSGLVLYYYATLPRRNWWQWQTSRHGAAPLVVLFYHRVADEHPNAWTIRPCQFARQVRWLESRFELVSLQEAQRRIATGNRRLAVSLTFDDGYADNCRWALPWLTAQGIPVTYFVSTRHVLEGAPFPHDVRQGVPLDPNTVAQLRQLAKAGVEIGSHTRTHADLGRITDPRELYDEVVVGTRQLASAVGAPIRYFAFPYGQPANLNAAVFRLAGELGLKGVCSAYGGYNFPGQDPFHLKRFHGDASLLRVRNWVSGDPRWLGGWKRKSDVGSRASDLSVCDGLTNSLTKR